MKVSVAPALPSLARVQPASREPLRVALVQTKWHSDPAQHLETLNEGIRLAANEGAKIVFLQELTLSRYMADVKPTGDPGAEAEPLIDGPTHRFAAAAAMANNIYVHASLFEKADFADGRGLNVAILVAPDGQIVARTPKLHIPITAGYYEDKYFAPGPAGAPAGGPSSAPTDGTTADPYPVYELNLAGTSAKFGLPTCWDEWFPEVARNYSLRGAEVLAYPTAIGSEPDHTDFDTEPLWRQVIIGNGIANGTFMVVPNRYGNEGSITFYGSSFISDPYGRVLVRAQREGDEVLVADLDLDQRNDWLELFPFLQTRRPDTYDALTKPVAN